MVKKRLQTILLLLVAGAILYFLCQRLFPNNERIIRQRLAGIAELASFSGQRSAAASLAAADRWRDYLTADVEVEVDVPEEGRRSFSGRQEIVQVAMVARTHLDGLKVELMDVQVTVADGQSATARFTARAAIPGQRDFFVQELQCEFRKEDRSWRIRRIETVRTLKL